MSTGAPQVLSPLVGGPAEQAAAAKERGTKAFRKKDFEGAINAYTEALAITPEDHTLLSNRSAAYGSLEKYKESWLDAKECTRLRPEWPKGFARLGFALVHLFRLEEAKEAYETGLALECDKDVEKTLRSGLEDVASKLLKETAAEAEAEKAEKAEKAQKAADRRRGLNHKPAWQSRGVGVNKELFGEVTGDLMKPGMTKADLERLEKSLPTGPDPFGDVFREGKGGGKAKPKHKAGAASVGAVSKAVAVRTYKALVSAPWRRSKAASAAPEDEDEAEYDPFAEEPVQADGKAPPFKASGPLLQRKEKAKSLPMKAPPKGKPLPFKAPPSMSKAAIKKATSFVKSKSRGVMVPPPPGAPGSQALGMPPLRGPPPRRGRRPIKVTIPEGVAPGSMFTMEVNGEMAQVQCPPDAGPGSSIWIEAVAPSLNRRMTSQQIEALKERVAQSYEMESEFRSQAGKGKGKGKRRFRGDADAAAASWLKQGGPRTSRVDKAAAIAEEWFAPKDEEPAAKKQKIESFTFPEEVLAKAPENIQTLRSLLQFLEKKLQADVAAVPELDVPKELQSRLAAYADKVGRLSGLRATSGWDARAKRILDVATVVKTKEGGAALEVAEKDLDKEKPQLEKLLKDKKLDECIDKRVAWAKDRLKRDWFLWCSRVVKTREAILSKETPTGKVMSTVAMVEALLTDAGDVPKPSASG